MTQCELVAYNSYAYARVFIKEMTNVSIKCGKVS